MHLGKVNRRVYNACSFSHGGRELYISFIYIYMYICILAETSSLEKIMSLKTISLYCEKKI